MKVHLVLLIILLLINIIPQGYVDRKKYILPISFVLILVYWAIRYDYGLDYWNYYDWFYSRIYAGDSYKKEPLFYLFFYGFKSYYQFIIAESVLTVITLFYFVRKYVPTTYYWLFFFLLFAVPSMHFNLISTMRSNMAACVLFLFYELFYISKKRWVLLIISVFVAAQFHNSAAVFILVPLAFWMFNQMRGNAIIITLLVCDLLSMFYTNDIYNWFVIQGGAFLGDYDIYSEANATSNINGFIMKSIILIPTYYMCNIYDRFKDNIIYRSIFILAFFFLLINMLGLNFNGRFTVYLYLFFIISLSITCKHSTKKERWIMLVPYFLVVVFGLVGFYDSMLTGINGRYSEGNPYFYSTIFDAPSLP